MRTLAIETATSACSIALFEGGRLLAKDHRVLGRGHAERLVEMIAQLPGRGEAQRVLVSRGPGSFTGVRIGIAAARALGIAWQAEVRGFPTLALVAATAAEGHRGAPISIAMEAGHGEVFVQNFDESGLPQDQPVSLAPEAAASAARHALIAGSMAEEICQLRGHGEAANILPDARFAPALDPALITGDLAPVYGRAPDARPEAPGAASREQQDANQPDKRKAPQ